MVSQFLFFYLTPPLSLSLSYSQSQSQSRHSSSPLTLTTLIIITRSSKNTTFIIVNAPFNHHHNTPHLLKPPSDPGRHHASACNGARFVCFATCYIKTLQLRADRGVLVLVMPIFTSFSLPQKAHRETASSSPFQP